jgi:hypothetical protein
MQATHLLKKVGEIFVHNKNKTYLNKPPCGHAACNLDQSQRWKWIT